MPEPVPIPPQPHRRRSTDAVAQVANAADELIVATATAKATLRLALQRMEDAMDRAEQVLKEEMEELPRGGR